MLPAKIALLLYIYSIALPLIYFFAYCFVALHLPCCIFTLLLHSYFTDMPYYSAFTLPPYILCYFANCPTTPYHYTLTLLLSICFLALHLHLFY